MRWALWIVGGVALLVALVAAVGFMLPSGHVAVRTARYAKPVDVVFTAISDFAGASAWRRDVTRVEMLAPQGGRTRFREHSNGDSMTLEVEELIPNRRLVTRIADPNLPFGGTWTYEIAPDGDGARLTITERGEVYNPIFRTISRFVIGHSATIDGYLTALGAKFGEQTTPAAGGQ